MPTYPTNPALEAAVIADAEDDTPRLAYADWLDENGDPEFDSARESAPDAL